MTQREAVETWWFDCDQPTRDRALELGATDGLPDDMALDLIVAGVVVPAGDDHPHQIPDVVHDFLSAVRELRLGARGQ